MGTPVLLLNGQPVAAGTRLDVSPVQVMLLLRIPVREVLDTAILRLAAASDAPAPLVPRRLSSNLGAFPGAPDKPLRFMSVELEGERAVTSLTLSGAAVAPGEAVAARVRTLSNGTWSPLTPIDAVALGDEQVFPAVAAQRLVAEFLKAVAPQTVPVPAPLSVTAVTLKGTPQPCHVAVAIDGDPPFFSLPGPLPTAPVAVDGLARAASRWSLDHPDATDMPLQISAAGGGALLITAFNAISVPAAEPDRPGDGSPGPGPVNPPPTPPPAPDTRRALLCGAGHVAAQGFAASPSGQGLAGFAMWVRCGSGGIAGSVTLHRDNHGTPAAQALPERLDFASGETVPHAPHWLVLAPAAPVRLAEPWWAVCRITQGELFWYRAPDTAGGGAAMVSVDGGVWRAAPPDPGVAGLQAVPSWTPLAT